MKHPFSKLFGQGEKQGIVETEQLDQQEWIEELLVESITPNRYQPRTVFHNDKIEELASTLETHGIIQPIVVRQYEEGKYEIIAGERRWRAASYLGWTKIPAIIKTYDDEKTAAVALIENLQREELTAVEEAMAYAKLIDIHGLTQESLAQQLGKGQSTIANKLRLLKLPTSIQNALLEKEITERHARALIALNKFPEKQEQVFKEIISKNLNVKQTENRIKELLDKKSTPKPKRKSVMLNRDVRIAVNTIRQSVSMVTETGMKIDTDEEDMGDYYQFTIKIPKSK